MRLIKIQNLVVIAVLFMGVSCVQKEEVQQDFPSEITIKGDKFVDELGRQVILNGINVISKSKEEGYMYQSGPELFEKLKSFGVNCIRLGIIWDGLEPEPGVYNEAYLKEIDKRIAWAEASGVFVVLDMHQDLYSVKYSDGAPEWATLDEGKTHTTGAIWSDAYMMSEAVQTSFDNFWLNKPASDGVGIQDHFSNLWKHVAQRYSDSKTVIGYDIMNEPFPGSAGVQSTMILLSAYGELYYSLTGEILTEEQLMQMWGDEDSRMEALKIISNKENYGKVFNQLGPLVKEFEANNLQNMYQKVSNAIREVDTEHILFLEHSYYGNTGVPSSIERVNLPDGTPDPLVAYAPHGYDLVTDTKAVASASNERVEYIYEQIKIKGEQLQMPVWLGEWGAFYSNSESVIPTAINAVGLIEENLFSNAYWSYTPETGDLEFFTKILVRSYPAFVNGELLNYKNDFEGKRFKMEWKEAANNSASTIVFVPNISKINSASLDKIGSYKIEAIKNSEAGWLYIAPTQKEGLRSVELVFDI